MFTGIIEQLGVVESIAQNGSNITYTIQCCNGS
jgi:riboflavin synthase alpha subunit